MQFGHTLEHLLYQIHHANPKYGPVYMSKIDISDGFYHVWLDANDAPALSVVLPCHPGELPLVAIPLTLPMGWVKSPPTFSAATEMVADLSNSRMQCKHWPPHWLEKLAETLAPSLLQIPEPSSAKSTMSPLPTLRHVTNNPLQCPLNYADVYVDDFIALCQGNKCRCRQIMCILLHTIDQVFAPLDET